jgi:hypothetical protein
MQRTLIPQKSSAKERYVMHISFEQQRRNLQMDISENKKGQSTNPLNSATIKLEQK